MKQILNRWYERYLSDPEAVILLFMLIVAVGIISTTGYMLAPVFAGIVLAYLLEGLVYRLECFKLPHWAAVTIVFIIFMGVFVLSLLVLFPVLIRQITSLFTELPSMIGHGQTLLMQLPERYPDFLSADQVQSFIQEFRRLVGKFGQSVLSFSISSIPGLITAIVYLVLVPLLVFFFLLDRDKIFAWLTQYLPKNRQVLKNIWSQVDFQLGNYVRGKVLEIIIVTVVTYIAFIIMGLEFALLLSVLVGLSVIIPFIGVTVVTIPVVIVAFLQWGASAHFTYFVIIYATLCILDANVLVPLLFSEAVNLHPIAIIVAILFFGGLWGFWGVFFAIPLATLVQAIIVAWPRSSENNVVSSSA